MPMDGPKGALEARTAMFCPPPVAVGLLCEVGLKHWSSAADADEELDRQRIRGGEALVQRRNDE